MSNFLGQLQGAAGGFLNNQNNNSSNQDQNNNQQDNQQNQNQGGNFNNQSQDQNNQMQQQQPVNPGSNMTSAGQSGQEDYADKGLDFLETKFGGGRIDPTKQREMNEKITDGARGMFEKLSG
jgi:hypothetical protein